MDDLFWSIAWTVLLVLACIGTLALLGVVWAMLVAAFRHVPSPRIGNQYILVECRHCGFRWYRLPDDNRPCPRCDDTGHYKGSTP